MSEPSKKHFHTLSIRSNRTSQDLQPPPSQWFGMTRGVRQAALVLLLASLLPIASCVTASRFDVIESERDQLATNESALEKQVHGLELANRALESERIRLFEELEDRREETVLLTSVRTKLEEKVSRLSERGENLDTRLREREAALGEAQREVDALQSTYHELVGDLEAELQQGAIEIEQLRSGLKVVVADEVLFASGSAMLGSEGRELLLKVALKIKPLDYIIDVEGHTDNLKIRGDLKKHYPSNWELAGARAASVVRLFVDSGIDGERLQAISRAEFHPVVPNEDAESRELNRRIEIRLRPAKQSHIDLPSEGASPETPKETSEPPKETPGEAATQTADEVEVHADATEVEEPAPTDEP